MKERPIEPNCFETDREEIWHDVGYYDGYKDAIDEACEWIEHNADKYAVDEHWVSSRLVEHLRNYLEE